MYSRKVDSEIFYDRRESVGSYRKSSLGSDYGSLKDDSSSASSCSSSDHYNPTLRLLQIPRSSNGSMGFHLTRSKWDPYPWISAVDSNTLAKFHGLKAGDCVLEVNGEDVLGMRLSEIAELVNCETKSIDNVSLLLWSPGIDINCNPTNLCCGPMPLNLERLTAFTQTILAIIECPVCLETIVPPILQCQNGHILCVKCRILSHTCPVCRQHFYPGRSLVAEQIYNSIMGTFNLRNPDKSQSQLQGCNGQQLFGAKYKRSSSISRSTTTSSSTKDERRQRREKQQHNSIRLKRKPPPHEVNKFESQQPSTNKFLAKLLGRAYSTDNLSSPCSPRRSRRRRCSRRQSAPLLSLTRLTIGRIANDIVGGENSVDDDDGDGDYADNDDDSGRGRSKANFNSSIDFDKQLEFGYQRKPVPVACEPHHRHPSVAISKQFSLSEQDLSKKDNDGLIAIQHECLSTNRLQYLWLDRNSVQMALLPICPQLLASSPPALTPNTGRREISATASCAKHLKDRRSPRESTKQISCCTSSSSGPELEPEQPIFFCPHSCGKQFSGQNLQQHIKVDHFAPILCYNSSSAELALPLRAPLDKAAVLLMCDGKDFWIKLRTHGEENITALALFQGSEDESSDFMMETRLRIRPGKDQKDGDDDDEDDRDEKDNDNDNEKEVGDDGYVKIVVNNDNRILERELITRSIVRSMMKVTALSSSSSSFTSSSSLYSSSSIEEETYVGLGNDEGDDDDDLGVGDVEKFRDFLYNQKNIRMIFGDKGIDKQNLFLKIIIKRR